MSAGRRTPGYREVEPVRDLVSEEEAWEAKVYLDEMPHKYAEAIAGAERAAYRLRMVEAAGIMVSGEKNAARQQADARTAHAYSRAVDEQYATQMRAEEAKAARASATLRIELYRTIRADKRAREAQDGPELRTLLQSVLERLSVIERRLDELDDRRSPERR